MITVEQLEAIINEYVREPLPGKFLCMVCQNIGNRVIHTSSCPILKLWELVEAEKLALQRRNTRGC